MKVLPKNGTRVTCRWRDRTLTGTVVKHYPSYRANGTERPFNPEWDAVSVAVDDLPEGWPYRTNRFAPRIEDVELLA